MTRSASWSLRIGQGLVGRRGQADQVVGRRGQLARHQREVVQELRRVCVVRREHLGHLGAVDERAVDVRAQAPAAVGQVADHGHQLGRVDGLEHRVEVGEHLLELEPALGVLDVVPVVRGTGPSSSSAFDRSRSTNFSPKRVLARMRAMAAVGTFWSEWMRIVTRAAPWTSRIVRTEPTLTPRTFTSEPGSRPWPAASKVPDDLVPAGVRAEGRLDPDGHDGREEQERDRAR